MKQTVKITVTETDDKGREHSASLQVDVNEIVFAKDQGGKLIEILNELRLMLMS